MIDQDGEWEVHSGYKLLIKPSPAYEAKRVQWAIEAAIAQAERDVVQAERDKCIAYLKKQPDLTKVDLKKAGYNELTLEMSFEDIITMCKNNREAHPPELVAI